MNTNRSSPRNRFRDPELRFLCEFRVSVPGDIEAGDLDLPYCEGATPLTRAVADSDLESVKALLEGGANPDAPDLRGATPLIYAAQIDNSSMANTLLEAGAEIDTSDQNGRAAVHYAFYLGNTDFVAMLRRRGASFDALDIDNRSPLDYARSASIENSDPRFAKLAALVVSKEHDVKHRKTSPIRSLPGYARIDGLRLNSSNNELTKRSIALVAATLLLLLLLDSDYGLFDPTVVTAIAAVVALSIFVVPLLYDACVRRITGSSSRNSSAGLYETLRESGINARSIAGLFRVGNINAHHTMSQLSEILHASKRFSLVRASIWLFTFAMLALLALLIYALVFFYVGGFIYGPLWSFQEMLWEANLIGFVVAVLLGFILAVFAVAAAIGPSILIMNAVIKTGHRKAIRSIELELLDQQRAQSAWLNDKARTLESGEMLENGVLFLRAFEVDQTIDVGIGSFESTLAYAMSTIGPLLALRAADSALGPANVETANGNWQQRVAEYSAVAGLIVLMPASSPGVRWEIDHLRREGLFEKTAFVAPPAGSNDDVQETWESMRQQDEFADLEIPPYCDDGFVFTLDSGGKLRSFGALGLRPPLQMSERYLRVADDGDDDGGDAGQTDGPTVQQQYSNLQVIMPAVAVMTTTQFSASGGDGSDGGDGGGDGGGG